MFAPGSYDARPFSFPIRIMSSMSEGNFSFFDSHSH